MKRLLGSGDGADVHFSVGEGDEKELLPAHKLILRTASDVFAAMFRFDAENAKSSAAGTAKEVEPVAITDVKVGAFKAMLAFIYADDLRGLNGDNAMDVLYTANKYNVAELIKACVNFPIVKLSNVFVAFDQARFLGEKILDRDQLFVCGEIAIWNAALCWADEKCSQKGKQCLAKNRRAVLGPALFKIRFPLISQKDFSKIIVPSGVLTLNQMMSIFLHYSHPDADQPELYPLQFPTKRRTATRSDDDGPYKPKGQIMLTIEKVSEFAREDENSRRLSDAVYIRGLPWKILATPRTVSAQKCLGFYLYCNTENSDANWNCAASATYKIVSQKKGNKDHIWETSHIFSFSSGGRIGWGFAHFMTFEELLGPYNGWHDAKNDTAILAVDVIAEQPLGVK
uniref:BTB domain-containing protein n=1 Tax=Globodera pallida TaxID=36090 RepID=A0A183BWT5_GLOPA